MFEYIKGTLAMVGKDYVVIDHNQIGYKVYTSNTSIDAIKNQGGQLTMFTHLVVREDDMSLFGFFTDEERSMFELLIGVSGIGPRVALGILSSISIENLIGMIVSSDIKSLTKAQGVGKKTAQRIILELKEKVDKQLAKFEPSLLDDLIVDESGEKEALEALAALGYSKNEAKEAISRVKNSSSNTEEMIKKALQVLVR